MSNSDLDQKAKSILIENDQGGYTVPTKGLYPYQWNWDSVFVALGFATFDQDRAWREIEMLFQGQWRDGMVPHILFRKDDPSYFPGPSVWGTDGGPIPSSGHSQPPVAATVIRELVDADVTGQSLDRAAALFPKLMQWHRWFLAYRDPQDLGVIAVIHPWESGRDNLPDWDDALRAVEIADIGPYERKDTSHVDPAMRPQKADYDRYLSIMAACRAVKWDPAEVARTCPFFVADPGVTFIFLRANRDLLSLAERLGRAAEATEIRGWIAKMEAGAKTLWNEDLKAHVAFDERSGKLTDGISSAAFLALYAGIRDETTMKSLQAHFDRIASKVRFLMPSYDPDHASYEPLRYWRGPVWAMINYMIARGFAEAGDTMRAERLRADTASLIETGGFAEYFSPETGAGAGGGTFSWTSAIWLSWASPTHAEQAA
ncbi:trehalase family glycosidase [uncultured Roseibium sp.]|uniref:MGH1-like glycoside hydrolase domain-containing protein n=1 Tax=uncultured Roseibium sp. TaxID=1936171 RepID=UPI00263025C6|nr:trehalase family glycosidase [uncultured Roseibium sp.]